MDFRERLLEYMERNGVTMAGLSEKLGYKSLNTVRTILKGYGSDRPLNKIALKDIPDWVKALHFSDAEAERFREDVNLDHCEEWFRKRYADLKASAAKRAYQ